MEYERSPQHPHTGGFNHPTNPENVVHTQTRTGPWVNPSTLYKARQLQLPSGEIRTPDLRIRSMLLWRTEGLEHLLDLTQLTEDTDK